METAPLPDGRGLESETKKQIPPFARMTDRWSPVGIGGTVRAGGEKHRSLWSRLGIGVPAAEGTAP